MANPLPQDSINMKSFAFNYFPLEDSSTKPLPSSSIQPDTGQDQPVWEANLDDSPIGSSAFARNEPILDFANPVIFSPGEYIALTESNQDPCDISRKNGKVDGKECPAQAETDETTEAKPKPAALDYDEKNRCKTRPYREHLCCDGELGPQSNLGGGLYFSYVDDCFKSRHPADLEREPMMIDARCFQLREPVRKSTMFAASGGQLVEVPSAYFHNAEGLHGADA